MGAWAQSRAGHYAVLIAVAAGLTLPNLGAASLWDVDEGVNAGAAREMREAGTWVVPTFNFELRTAKPVLLYWLQRASYAAFGVSEWSARLPSALAAMLTVLLTYELARRLFGPSTGLLAGVVLASAIEFCVLAHAATPDSTLLLFTVLTYYLFWLGQENGGRAWWRWTAAACGLAALTKGPVGIAVPGLVIALFFLWNREARRLWDRRLASALFVGLLVAGPWYILVATETRGEWSRAFFLNENVNRAMTPMDGHRGPVFYHVAGVLVLFAPWSAFLAAAVWYGFKAARTTTAESPETAVPGTAAPEPARPYRLLLCWAGAYLAVFSLAATKLPNYVLPLYPAVAILTARFLVRWRDGSLPLPRWVMPAAVGGVLLVAAVTAGGLLAAGGALPFAGMRTFPGLERWAALAVVPLAGAVAMAWRLRLGDRPGVVRAASLASVLFVGLLATFPAGEMDLYKAPRDLVRESGAGDPSRDIRLASFEWFQPSVVFYAEREVKRLPTPERAAAFLATPSPGYLFIPEPIWKQLEPAITTPCRVAARRYDFYTNHTVIVVTNEPDMGKSATATLLRGPR